jgi:hypothetical protein
MDEERGGSAGSQDEEVAFIRALRDLDHALDDNVERASRMKHRIAELEAAFSAGRPITEVMPAERTPPLVQLLTESADALHVYGSRVRKTEARALHREGLTMDEIAHLFGVTRQRVSALLRDDAPAE